MLEIPANHNKQKKQNMKPIVALKTYFGMTPGQKLSEFQAECKALEAQCGSREAYLAFCGEVCKALGVELIPN